MTNASIIDRDIQGSISQDLLDLSCSLVDRGLVDNFELHKDHPAGRLVNNLVKGRSMTSSGCEDRANLGGWQRHKLVDDSKAETTRSSQ